MSCPTRSRKLHVTLKGVENKQDKLVVGLGLGLGLGLPSVDVCAARSRIDVNDVRAKIEAVLICCCVDRFNTKKLAVVQCSAPPIVLPCKLLRNLARIAPSSVVRGISFGFVVHSSTRTSCEGYGMEHSSCAR